MPSILKLRPYELFFFSGGRTEPPHDHGPLVPYTFSRTGY